MRCDVHCPAAASALDSVGPVLMAVGAAMVVGAVVAWVTANLAAVAAAAALTAAAAVAAVWAVRRVMRQAAARLSPIRRYVNGQQVPLRTARPALTEGRRALPVAGLPGKVVRLTAADYVKADR